MLDIVAAISRETLRGILHDGGVSWQATKTWKASNDPEFLPKMRRVLDLYDNPPAGGRVVCVDEFGPLNLMPRTGKTWRPVGRPARQRATYTRTQGVRHMFAALDLATGRITYRIRERKRWPQFLDFLKALRRHWPDERLYLVTDNYGPHKRPEVRAWCADNDVELVFLPTNASWLSAVRGQLFRQTSMTACTSRSRTGIFTTSDSSARKNKIKWRFSGDENASQRVSNRRNKKEDGPLTCADS